MQAAAAQQFRKVVQQGWRRRRLFSSLSAVINRVAAAGGGGGNAASSGKGIRGERPNNRRLFSLLLEHFQGRKSGSSWWKEEIHCSRWLSENSPLCCCNVGNWDLLSQLVELDLCGDGGKKVGGGCDDGGVGGCGAVMMKGKWQQQQQQQQKVDFMNILECNFRLHAFPSSPTLYVTALRMARGKEH